MAFGHPILSAIPDAKDLADIIHVRIVENVYSDSDWRLRPIQLQRDAAQYMLRSLLNKTFNSVVPRNRSLCLVTPKSSTMASETAQVPGTAAEVRNPITM